MDPITTVFSLVVLAVVAAGSLYVRKRRLEARVPPEWGIPGPLVSGQLLEIRSMGVVQVDSIYGTYGSWSLTIVQPVKDSGSEPGDVFTSLGENRILKNAKYVHTYVEFQDPESPVLMSNQ